MSSSKLMEENRRIYLHTHQSDTVARATLGRTTRVEHYNTRRQIIYSDSSDSSPFEKLRERYWGDRSPGESMCPRRLEGVSRNADSDSDTNDIVNTVDGYRRLYRERQRRGLSLFLRTWTMAVTVITTCYTRVKDYFGLGGTRTTWSSANYRQLHEASKWRKVRRLIHIVRQYFYLLVENTLALDLWLLSRFLDALKRFHIRRTKLLWALLSPLLLLVGWWCLPVLLSTNNDEMDAIKVEMQSLREQQLQLKASFDKPVTVPEIDIEKHVDSILARYFDNEKHSRQNGISRDEISKINDNLLIAKSDLEARISNINMAVQINAQKINDRYDKFMSEIENQIKMISKVESGGRDTGGLTKADIRRIVTEALEVYNADKTGRVDYALESAGGQIVSTRSTQNYIVNVRKYTFLGFTLYYEKNNCNRRIVIQGSIVQPGACWAFQGFPGYLLIRLRSFVKVTGFTMEHVPRSILANGEMRSAPREFNVWGLKDENDGEPVKFGDYEFIDSNDSLQYFPVRNTSIAEPYEFVELRIHSNHGELEYTCLYRFRVHGTIA